MESDEKLQRFQQQAEQLAQATGLDWMRFGLVYTTDAEQSQLLAFSLELRREEEPRETLNAAMVHAERASAPRRELPSLVAQLMNGRLEQLSPIELVPPVLLNRGDKELYLDYHEDRQLDDRRFVVIRGRPKLGFSDIQPRLTELDRAVATSSNFRLANLGRLVAAYTGLKFDQGGREVVLQLTAPWPIHSLSAERAGKRVRLELIANSDFDPQRLAINIESPEGDRRLEPKQIEWLHADRSRERTLFRGTLSPGVWATAVNVFFEPMPLVTLSAEVRNEPATQEYLGGEMREAAPRATSENARLLGIEARGYRSLRDVKLDLEPLTVLVGQNQAGKTSVLDALSVISEGARGGLAAAINDGRGGLDAISFKSGAEMVSRVELAATVALSADLFRYSFSLRAAGTRSFAVESELLEMQRNDRWVPIVQFVESKGLIGATQDIYVAQPAELALTQIKDPGGQGYWEDIRAALASIAIYPGFHAAPPGTPVQANTLRGPASMANDGHLFAHGENLSAALSGMQRHHEEAWEHLQELTRLVFPDFIRLSLAYDVMGNALLQWHDKAGVFDAPSLSAGTLHFLATLCALFQEGTSVIGLDEPEQHLHPDALIRIFGAAQSVSALRPVIIATQSTYLLELLSETPQSLVIARRGLEGTELIRPGEEHLREWLKDFSLGQIRTDLENWVAK